MDPMKNRLFCFARPARWSLSGLAAVLLTGCASVPMTDRSQLQLVPMGQMAQLSSQQYREVLSQSKVLKEGPQADMVRRVGGRIARATEDFADLNGIETQFDWEFNLIKDDNQVNAWAMPGGKVAFYTGILPLTRNETGVAVVMGHEVAHVLARHGSERFSQNMLAQVGTLAVAQALKSKPEATANLVLAAVGAGAQVGVLLPYSRLHEAEADRIGLMLMAMAGYDPREAVPFWQRMAEKGGAKPPEFLSTHPADSRRVAELQRHMPEALKLYRAAGTAR
jgi:predicted Zn-dependent protease